MSVKLDHIAVAVGNSEAVAKIYEHVLGLDIAHVEKVIPQKTKVSFLPVGDTQIELVEPIGDDAPIAKYLDKKGPGLHHLCFEVDDIDAELARLDEAGVQLIDKTARPGAHNTRIAFIHPKAMGGVLVELAEKPKD